jgi:peptidoglycan hydrolase CwlO-like protein
MNQHKLPAVLGIVILAGILIYIVKLNEKTKQEIGDQDRRLTATKSDQTQQEEDIKRLRIDLEALRRGLSSAKETATENSSKLRGELEKVINKKEEESDQKFIGKANYENDLGELRAELEEAYKKLEVTNNLVKQLKEELERTKKELKALKATPSPAPKPAAVTSSGQPK